MTITYRTTDRPPGEPTSAHQCLLQMKGFNTDRQELLAICNRSGTVALAWNAPERWRMDVVTADDAFAVVATPIGLVPLPSPRQIGAMHSALAQRRIR